MLQKPTYKWYAVYTRPNNEKKIYSTLIEDNIECYLPLKRSLRKWSDRKKWIEEPLFKSYIFVKVSHIEYFNVLSIPGVVYYVKFGGQPQSIPDNQIDYIKTIVQQKEKEVEVNYENIRKGSECEVLVGPLKGVKGEIVRISGQSRLLIRLASMGVSLHVNIAKDEIKLIKNKTVKTPQKKYHSLDSIPYRKGRLTV
ncbi:MAG: UpxY family transcription antiterminator [Bacteroidales bacterium]